MYIGILCHLYSATDETTEHLTALVANTKKPDPWRRYADLIPEHHALLISLEAVAETVTTFQSNLIPDLLRTPDYQQSIARMEGPLLASHETERLPEILALRQARLRSDTAMDFQTLMCETALHNSLCDPEVMHNQLQHMVVVGELPNVSIRIVPQHTSSHVGVMTGPFALMEFPTHPASHLTEPPVVYVPGYTYAHYLDHKSAITQYRTAITEINQVALDEDTSRQLLLQISRERLFPTTLR